MEKITASIITIGDELLIGQVVDTNSTWMAKELNKIGVWVQRRLAVGDDWNEIWKALNEESSNSDIILITGGLGPTGDDITKPLLCQYFNGNMVMDVATLEHITYIFEVLLKRPMIERNRKQAEIPDTCTILKNERGTAPGMLFEKNGKIFISMPGVPHEMKGIMQDHVLKLLQQRFSLPYIGHRTLLTFGIGESFLAEKIKDFEGELPNDIKLAYLPNYGMVRLRLTSIGEKIIVEKELDNQFRQLKELVKEYLVTDTDLPMHIVMSNLLKKHKKTLATAESCTGGYIAQQITSVAGASEYFTGSVVCYHNSIKRNLLHVSHETLAVDGAVSEATVTQMAKGVLEEMKTDYAIAVSGIMGPDGGSPEKPVGTVWIAVADSNKVESFRLHFRFDRQKNIELTAINAMNFLRLFIL
ncbi:MAG: competence/damage-inducible protein A, partial [Ferruginibacter sp.]